MYKPFETLPKEISSIEMRKTLNDLLLQSRKKSKPDKCILCGQSQTSFCNSHSVPRLSLKTIADNGMVLQASAFTEFNEEVVDKENGINKSGTFNYICRECDSTYFKDYENVDNLLKVPSDKMLAEIALKNFLLQLSKRSRELEFYKIAQKDFEIFVNAEDLFETIIIDYKEFEKECSFHKRIIETGETGGYQILYHEILPYKVPIAAQSAIALREDMENNQVNDIFNYDEENRTQYMHICILPFDNDKSVVLAFYHKRDKLYKGLRHQFNSISKEKKLAYINYLIFAYTENCYISKKVEKELESNEKLIAISQEYNGEPDFGILCPENLYGFNYEAVDINEIPNLLDPVMALK